MAEDITSPVNSFADELFRLGWFVEVAIGGFGLHSEEIHTLLQKRLRKLPPPLGADDDYKQGAEKERKVIEFSEVERKAGFPYLFGVVTVRLYSIIEGAVDALFLAALKERPECLGSEAISRLKGPLIAFLRATAEDRAELIRERLLQEASIPQKVGAGRFETVLASVGLNGPLPGTISRILLELSEVRHVIVHRNGFGDRKFSERCPWLGIDLGKPIRLTSQEFFLYNAAATWYLNEIDMRWSYGPEEGKRKLDPGWATLQKLLEVVEHLHESLTASRKTKGSGTS